MYCTKCGGKTKYVSMPDDNYSRNVCAQCQHIHYVNPKIIVGTIPTLDNTLLLCRRSISPGYGKWTFPSGYMEMGESLEDGAIRESSEEANLDVRITKLYGNYSIPDIGQVLFVYLGEITSKNFSAGSETLEVKLFDVGGIPWMDIAFPSVKFFLEKYANDYKNNKKFKYHSNFMLNNSE
tara:strand:- start:711 stop:1250 length:540 start_codon:yes stop_codon:yes gene_type:complete